MLAIDVLSIQGHLDLEVPLFLNWQTFLNKIVGGKQYEGKKGEDKEFLGFSYV